MIKLEQFSTNAYPTLISWVRSEEALMQFAGPAFSFPLTAEQLDQSLADKNRTAFSVVEEKAGEHIGHCEIHLSAKAAILSRIIIGDERHRGKGYGQQIVRLLIEWVHSHGILLPIELYVFDWNVGAIKCYEKVGFVIDPGKTLERKVKGQTWIVLHMVLRPGG